MAETDETHAEIEIGNRLMTMIKDYLDDLLAQGWHSPRHRALLLEVRDKGFAKATLAAVIVHEIAPDASAAAQSVMVTLALDIIEEATTEEEWKAFLSRVERMN